MPIRQRVRLESERRYGPRVPAEAGRFLTVLQPALRGATALRVQGKSALRGPHKWLRSAGRADVVGIEGNEHPELVLEVYTVQELFPKLYSHVEIWPTRPDPSATVLDLLADTVADVSHRKTD